MQDIDYWIETFLSEPSEVAAFGLALFVFAVAAMLYPDEKDKLAVVVGVLLLAAGLGLAGPDVGLEWHYWLGGGVLAAVAIMVVDRRG